MLWLILLGKEGLTRIIWDGKDSVGGDPASGVYLCRLTADNLSASTKLLLVE
jgi:hypothetical protein